MKRLALSLFITLAGCLSSFGIGIFSFTDAQEQAYYLTDKMAYELDLTPAQYDQVYQVNLEYFLNVDEPGLYGYYWDYRNTDLSYILYDWQYARYRRATYFYRPIEWRARTWYMPLWERYHRSYFFFNRPTIWTTWRGGLWHGRVHNTPSPFIGHRPPQHNGGMRHDRPGHPGFHPGYQPDHNNGHNNGYRPGHNDGYRPGGGSVNRPNGGSNRPDGNVARPGGNSNRPSGGNYGGGNNRPSGGNYGGGNYGGGNRGTGAQSGGSRPSRSAGGVGGSNAGTSRGGGRR